MEQEQKLINQEKMNQVLAVIGKNSQNTIGGTMLEWVFNGKIGGDIAFVGKVKWKRMFGENFDPDVEVHLSDNHRKRIADVKVEYNGLATNLGDISKKSMGYNKMTVVSSEWDKKNGVKTIIARKGKKGGLHVYHAQNETAADVIDNLHDVVLRSQAKEKIAQKLSKLIITNLHLRTASVNTAKTMYDATEQNRSQDNGREM